jgi:hypothetical protein
MQLPQANEFVKAAGQQQAFGLQLELIRLSGTELPCSDGGEHRISPRLEVDSEGWGCC